MFNLLRQSSPNIVGRSVRLKHQRRLKHTVRCQLGDSELELSTGHMARFANAAVVASTGDNAVLATCVHKSRGNGNDGGVPLTVDFRQSAAAVGRIPTNYLRRELSQSDADILSGRLVDRSLRPMIEQAWANDTHIVIKPMALDDDGDSVILGLNAAATALHISSVPLINPVAGVRVAVADGKIYLNPNRAVLGASTLNMVLSGTRDKRAVMIEMEGSEVPLEIVESAFDEGFQGVERLLEQLDSLRTICGKEKAETVTESEDNNKLAETIRSICDERLEYILTDSSLDKTSRDEALKEVEEELIFSSFKEPETIQKARKIYHRTVKEKLRSLVINTSARCDGRGPTDFRPISIEVDVYKKLHGSALFQRGQTQVLSTVTFDSLSAAFHPDSISQLLGAQQKKSFMLHYEFPQFATNEIGSSRGTNRREIGHGALAEKALKNVIPNEFPYTIRVTSQVLESNGSSSMASACSGSLALYDAGVPLKAPVAGVAIGIVTDDNDRDNKYKVLTDILGIEDYAGDMDFKIAGTPNGFTAMQMDLKIPGLSRAQLSQALHQGQNGLRYVLDKMSTAIARPRDGFKTTVPVLESLTVEPYKKSMIFRNGGLIAKTIEAETGVRVSVEDDTRISFLAPSKAKLVKAKEQLHNLLNEGAVDEFNFGQLIQSEVAELVDRGALVRLRPGGRTYLVPNSQLSSLPIKHPSAAGLKIGQRMPVQWLGRDESGNPRLSRRLTGTAGGSPVSNAFGRK